MSRYDEENRGIFGYEGEGYMRGGGRDVEDRLRRPSFRGLGPKNYQRSDERIREEVCERLTDDDYVDATGIEVSVEEGVVVLSGAVDDRRTKRRAEDVTESVRGVKDIQNQIRVAREND
jgi:osmotically-inducible protein OsmY